MPPQPTRVIFPICKPINRAGISYQTHQSNNELPWLFRGGVLLLYRSGWKTRVILTTFIENFEVEVIIGSVWLMSKWKLNIRSIAGMAVKQTYGNRRFWGVYFKIIDEHRSRTRLYLSIHIRFHGIIIEIFIHRRSGNWNFKFNASRMCAVISSINADIGIWQLDNHTGTQIYTHT